MNHTSNSKETPEMRCSCPHQEAITFLDTSCWIEKGKIVFDLFKKPTDRNMYLLPSSCHPQQHHKNVPFGLAMRINRVCTFPETRDKRLSELQEMLLKREYQPGMVIAALNKARNIPRDIALKKVVKPSHQRRPIAVVSWDPRLPSIDAIQQKHYRSMTSLDPYLKEVYPEAPIIAYRRPKNIREYLIRAKLPPKNQINPTRHLKGMKKCKMSCLICPYIQEGKDIKHNGFKWNIITSVNCATYNSCYMLICIKEKCIGKEQYYIGETERKLKDRICEHLGYINTKNTAQPAGYHFNLPGHSKSDMRVTVLEKQFKQDPEYRKERESFLIRKFNTYRRGMNKKP